MKQPINWLLVGTSDIANKRVASALKSAKDSILLSVCGRNEQKVCTFADTHGIEKRYCDLDSALKEENISAVYIATPVFLHAEGAIKAINAGKHVLIEKPLALNARQAQEIADMAEAKKVKAGVAYYRRFFPRYRMAKEMIDKNSFGRIIHFNILYSSWFSPEKTDAKYWRVEKEKSGGGVLSDMGSHMFDIIIGLFGSPVSVSAKCENVVRDWSVEDSANITMRFKNGISGNLFMTWASKTWAHEMTVIGTEAKLVWNHFDAGKVTKTVGRETEEMDMPNAGNVHLPLVEDFVSAIINDRQPEIDVTEGAKTNVLLDAVYESSKLDSVGVGLVPTCKIGSRRL